MDGFSLDSSNSEFKSKQTQCLIKANLGKFQLGDTIVFTYHTARIFISPPWSLGFSSAALLKGKGTPEALV